ncbi:MAG: hypothetical protein ACJ79E_00620 [Anaeromyxobacteraceae bacterium]
MNARAKIAAAALPLLLAACFIFTSQPRPTPEEGGWARERDHFSATAKLYDGLTTRAFASAIYQAPSVREARVARLAEWQNMTAAERDKLLASERDEAEKYDDFLVSLFTVDRPENDLDTSKSVWRVALVLEGEGELLPDKIEAIRTDATLRTLYPTIGDFDVVYRVRFARRPGTPLADRVFTLRLASARGRLEFPFPAAPK